MDRRELAMGAIALLGVALVLYGMTMPEFVGGLNVDGPIDESSVGNYDVTAYEDLNAENRELFDSALANDGSTNYYDGDWDADVVAYDGKHYRTLTWGGGNGRRTWTMNVGGVLTALGVGSFTGLGLVKRWKRTRTA